MNFRTVSYSEVGRPFDSILCAKLCARFLGNRAKSFDQARNHIIGGCSVISPLKCQKCPRVVARDSDTLAQSRHHSRRQCLLQLALTMNR
jgi:hypothetical protein